MQVMRVRFLVGELRSHLLWSNQDHVTELETPATKSPHATTKTQRSQKRKGRKKKKDISQGAKSSPGGGPLFLGASEELETGLVEAQREQGLEQGAGELGRTQSHR